MTTPTAGVILIGNELLSGRTQDLNLAHIAKNLGLRGIPVVECRVIPDDEATIIETVNHFRQKYTFVFTTGGIGPTHDDITTACIAKAFGVSIYRNQDVVEKFKTHYGDRATAATYRMCDFPEGAVLIENAATIAPGFSLGNVYVMAGIPRIMQAMLEVILPTLPQGEPIHEVSFTAHTTEGKISAGFEQLQNQYPQLALGSYPQMIDGKPAVSLVARGLDKDALHGAAKGISALLTQVEAIVLEAPPGWPQSLS